MLAIFSPSPSCGKIRRNKASANTWAEALIVLVNARGERLVPFEISLEILRGD